MVSFSWKIALALGFSRSLCTAISTDNIENTTLEQQKFNCSGSTAYLTKADCQRLSNLCVANVGANVQSPSNSSIWIGNSGTFGAKFINTSKSPIILVAWSGSGDEFVSVVRPQLTVSMKPSATITVSFSERIGGGWSGLYPGTTLVNGIISNTWGEFATGTYRVMDVSREANMSGNSMEIQTPRGCTSDMQDCVYLCSHGNSCLDQGSDDYQQGNGNCPSVGCQGWDQGDLLVNLGS